MNPLKRKLRQADRMADKALEVIEPKPSQGKTFLKDIPEGERFRCGITGEVIHITPVSIQVKIDEHNNKFAPKGMTHLAPLTEVDYG